ncbi:hypothetical protein FSARC_11954 [Fusarium sarcochroum]|uniref:Uncharacterized protein n=1 Tax=Fusarium sarcochroum TaxID=1208366 RepID=A0A8H4TCD7_9HYPO|nr:hypothetical protein FSARC_11954 [Fusarium sarcochroum]
MKAPRDKLLSEALASFELENEDPLNLLCLQGDLHPMRGCTGPSLNTLKVNLSPRNSDLTALFKERHRHVVSAGRDDSNRNMLLDNALSYLQEDAATRWSYWLRQSGRANATKNDLPHWSCCDNSQGDEIVGTGPEPLVLSNHSDTQEPAEFAPHNIVPNQTRTSNEHIPLSEHELLQQHLRMIDALLADSDLSPNQESEAILSNDGDVRRHSEPAAPALIVSTPREETSGSSTPSGPSSKTTMTTAKRKKKGQRIGGNKRAKITLDTVDKPMGEPTNHYGSTDSQSPNHSHSQSSPTNLHADHQTDENGSNRVQPHFSGGFNDELGGPCHVNQVDETNAVRAGVDNFACLDVVYSTNDDIVSSVGLNPDRGSPVWSILDVSGCIEDNMHAFPDPSFRTTMPRKDRPIDGYEMQVRTSTEQVIHGEAMSPTGYASKSLPQCTMERIPVAPSVTHLNGLWFTHQETEPGAGKHLLELEVATLAERPEEYGDGEVDAQSVKESYATKFSDLAWIGRVDNGMSGSNHRTKVSTFGSSMSKRQQPYAVNMPLRSRRYSNEERKAIEKQTWINYDGSERAPFLDDAGLSPDGERTGNNKARHLTKPLTPNSDEGGGESTIGTTKIGISGVLHTAGADSVDTGVMQSFCGRPSLRHSTLNSPPHISNVATISNTGECNASRYDAMTAQESDHRRLGMLYHPYHASFRDSVEDKALEEAPYRQGSALDHDNILAPQTAKLAFSDADFDVFVDAEHHLQNAASLPQCSVMPLPQISYFGFATARDIDSATDSLTTKPSCLVDHEAKENVNDSDGTMIGLSNSMLQTHASALKTLATDNPRRWMDD